MKKHFRRVISTIWVVCISLAPLWAQELRMMSREEAGLILTRILQVGNYPGTAVWLTTTDLPNQIEVDFFDSDLQTFLLEQGRNHVFTMKRLSPDWFEMTSPFEDAYLFPIIHNHLPGRYEIPDVLVNAWTGKVKIDLPPDLWEKTNTERGLGLLPPLTREQKKAKALEIMRNLYGDNNYVVAYEKHPSDFGLPDDEYYSFFIIYNIDSFTGARLPNRALICINSRTGALEMGEFYNRPVNISTKPKISEIQARQMALNYINEKMLVTFQEWLHGYLRDHKIGDTIFIDHIDEGLFVIEDGLLEQHLIWMFPFKMTLTSGEISAGVISVNAHTGEIMLDFQANLEILRNQWQQKRLYSSQEYQIPFLIFNNRSTLLWTPLRLINGRLYIAICYVDNLGGYWDGERIYGRKGIFKIDTKERLWKHEQLFLPLKKVCQATGIRLWWDNERKVPILRAEWLEPKRFLVQRR